jgi:hypothetical protein
VSCGASGIDPHDGLRRIQGCADQRGPRRIFVGWCYPVFEVEHDDVCRGGRFGEPVGPVYGLRDGYDKLVVSD